MKTITQRHKSRLPVIVLVMSLLIMPALSRTEDKGPAKAFRAHNENDLRIEGEQRFRTNCGRCHMAPQKFPPRMMATIIRHMRVRATLTDEDMQVILRYMTQ